MIVLAMIARDEERCIARCLASAAPHVDAMLVVDTGSRDATAAIAAAAGARVGHFAWGGDFSAARNHALALAADQWGPAWALVLDADEWIAGGGEALRAHAAIVPTVAGQVRIENEFDDGTEVRVAASGVTRLLPPGTRYRGRIHEQPVLDAPARPLPVRIGHDGYRRAQRAGKAGRNEELLRRELAASGDAYAHYQLGKELEVQGRAAEALESYGAARARLAGAAGADLAPVRAAAPWAHDLAVRQAHCATVAGDPAAAEGFALADAAAFADSPDVHFALGLLLLECAIRDPRRAPQLLPRIEGHWQRCLALGERPDLEGAVQGRGSFLAAANLAAFHEAQGHADEAAAWRQRAESLRAGAAAASGAGASPARWRATMRS